MVSFELTDIHERLKRLGVRAGDTVLMHSSLLPLGILQGSAISETPIALLRCILDHLGHAGTLAMPAFNFGFAKGIPFDRGRTDCAAMGQMAEMLRAWSGSRRSRHPMQSVSAVGALARAI